MVYKIAWTPKALQSYISNIQFLQTAWTEREVKNFLSVVEKKLAVLSGFPETGISRSKKHRNIRHTFLHKRISLIYRVENRKKQVELLLFWNTYQNPARLSIKQP